MGQARVPGPRLSKPVRRDRPLTKTYTAEIQQQYDKGYRALKRFLKEHDAPSPSALAEAHPRVLNEALSGWIRFCYSEGLPLYHAKAAVLKFSDNFWWTRPSLKACWDLIGEWEHREPPDHREPAPAELVQSIIGVALAWGWWRVACLIWIEFHCLLRPGEGIDLLAGDFEHVEHGDVEVIVVTVREPKTKRRFAQKQHVIIDEPRLIALTNKLLAGRDESEYFYGMSAATFNNRIALLLERIGAAGAFTAAGLRSGGATLEWLKCRNFDGLRLRGRWMSSRTLESYIQECATQLKLSKYSLEQRKKFRELALMAMEILEEIIAV